MGQDCTVTVPLGKPQAKQPAGTEKRSFYVPKDRNVVGLVLDCGTKTQKAPQTDNLTKECTSCSWTSRVGNFFKNLGRGIVNCTSNVFKGLGSFVCGTLGFAGGLLGGVGNALGRFGATMASYNPPIVVQQPMVTYSQPSIIASPVTYSTSTGGSFLTGLLYGSLLNKGGHHCHHNTVTYVRSGFRPAPILRPLGRPCHWC